jgi:hypothetical protein
MQQVVTESIKFLEPQEQPATTNHGAAYAGTDNFGKPTSK